MAGYRLDVSFWLLFSAYQYPFLDALVPQTQCTVFIHRKHWPVHGYGAPIPPNKKTIYSRDTVMDTEKLLTVESGVFVIMRRCNLLLTIDHEATNDHPSYWTYYLKERIRPQMAMSLTDLITYSRELIHQLPHFLLELINPENFFWMSKPTLSPWLLCLPRTLLKESPSILNSNNTFLLWEAIAYILY